MAARCLRGGSWNNDNTDNFRCANRNNNNPDNRNDNHGFRCASALSARVPDSKEAGRVRERVQADALVGASIRRGPNIEETQGAW